MCGYLKVECLGCISDAERRDLRIVSQSHSGSTRQGKTPPALDLSPHDFKSETIHQNVPASMPETVVYVVVDK